MNWKFASEEIHQELEAVCQHNAWLMRGGIDFEDDFCLESDYPYRVALAESRGELKRFFRHGNWSIRQGIVYGDLAFINQVNAGDEWWTLKKFDGKWVPFESITFCRVISNGEFEELIGQLEKATKQECLTLTYGDHGKAQKPERKQIPFVETEMVNYYRNQIPTFAAFIGKCLVRFESGDWGDISREDREANEINLNNKIGRYKLPADLIIGNEKVLWVLRDYKRTTVLFPDEY